MPEITQEELDRIEAGRLFFARPWRFVLSAPTVEALPPIGDAEVAFAGRSNVGKSSLINALTGRSGLARTSNTPGRTQELNFFTADSGLWIVDMPGYGYAEAPKKLVEAWNKLIRAYLRGRVSLRRVYVLIDSRHGLKANDLETLNLLDETAVSYQIVLTKVDKLRTGEIDKVQADTIAKIARRPAAHPVTLATSSETGEGMDLLKAEIVALAG
ncbi:YihA family ribosome biogenesis GTP-binding protein [Kaistia algarum]|uniref:ribosome biogenesis GTP-binding protein YihA/YsxC n=1 Tax=Kaistia algarum TaxID=2083279 RepID=UPI000CE7F8B8|nr:ribosome biogenesis GTP-binding protein YihA/YsxC [Kaistia algarum]MCX5516614.1 ribosome biogenesis GTP-binding protein YihA/YsxC [Kaistia algarum]PPE77746.1 YihA family ribosome biogenesis GTP-binding protein [Kaistia algarum]